MTETLAIEKGLIGFPKRLCDERENFGSAGGRRTNYLFREFFREYYYKMIYDRSTVRNIVIFLKNGYAKMYAHNFKLS